MSEDMKVILSAITDLRDDMNAKFAEVDQKLSTVMHQVAHNTEKLNEITSAQERQERILEILSKRSIEHESYIRKQY
mgnify:CR=1 FL=1